MDFFEHQERARRQTGLLVAYFIVAVALIILAVYFAVVLGLGFAGQTGDSYGPVARLWIPEVFLAVSAGTLLLIGVGSLYKIAELSGGGEVVARGLGGRRVLADTHELRERVLLNVVEEMAIASGTPVPPVFLLDDERAINAFAAGTSPQNAVVAVTRGSIDTLSRDELQGVIAHEFSHILNGDMRLNLRLIGLLNGILLIAMIGYFLMRSGSSRLYFSTSSSNKKGGNPLPLLGLCLYVIGYVGVFFGHLIKSAVSRQREFLADASAVQFTRLPDGIAGALKKIGGLVYGSRLQAPRAEEASHMYFGNGIASPILALLATHPPLAERIRRIDPTFDGRFPQAGEIAYSAGDEFVASLPQELLANVRNPLGAVAAICALLLADDDPTVRASQLEYLATTADPRANQETLRIAPVVSGLKPEAKLPLVSMALPALKGLSVNQLAAFRDDAVFLIRADQKVTLFEYAVQRLVLKRLLPRLEQKPPPRIKYDAVAPLASATSALLSSLARCGTRDEAQAERAFRMGVERLAAIGGPLKLLPRDECELAAIDAALDQLASSAPALKKQVIAACAACIGADGRVTVEEGELLRVISDALDCPMPPLLKER